MLSTKESTGATVTFVKMKSPKNEAPYFVTQKKEGDKWVDGETGNNIRGTLVAVAHDTYEWEGQKKDTIKLEFESEGGRFVVESNLTMLARSVINSLASADLNGLSDISIQLYESKSGYASAYVTENGAKLDWKWESKDQPEVIITKLPDGSEHKSYKAINDFFIRVLLEEISLKLGKTDAPAAPKPAEAPVSAAEATDNDLPF